MAQDTAAGELRPGASIRLGGRKLTREQVIIEINAAYAEGLLADGRAERIMNILTSRQLVERIARAIPSTHVATEPDALWPRLGGTAQDMHRKEAVVVRDAILAMIKEHTSAST